MKHKKIITAIVLVFLLIIYFYKVVFLGRALSSTDNLYLYPPFKSYAPYGFTNPVNPDPTILDQTMQFYPFLYFARVQIRQGHLPLWNPYIMMGAPFLADAQSAVLYPVNLVFYIFPFKDAFAISAFIRLFIAGLGMFIFVDALGLEFLAALFAGISFMFCAFNIVWLNHPLANVSVLLPWLFLLVYKFINTGKLKYTGWLALIIGIQFLGGHPETSSYILLATLIYSFTLLTFQYKDKRPLSQILRKLMIILISLTLGFMLASPMLLPFLTELIKSATWSLRSKPNHFFLSLKELPVLLAPQFYGTPIHSNYWGPLNFNEQSGYIGISALMFVIIAMVYRRYRNREIIFFFSLALGSLLITFGIPPFFQMFIALPFFSHMVNQRLILIYQFSMIVLSGIGIDIILKWADKQLPGVMQKTKNKERTQQKIIHSKQPITFKRLALISTYAAFSCIAIEIIFTLFLFSSGKVQHFDSTIYKSIMISFVFMILFILILYSGGSDRKIAFIVIIGLQFIDLFVFGHAYNPEIRKEWIFPHIPVLSNIREHLGFYRLSSLGPNYLPNELMVYGIEDIRGYDFPVNKRYNTFFPLLNDNKVIPDLWYGIFRLKKTYEKTLKDYLELMGVKYIPDATGKNVIQFPLAKRAYLVHHVIPASTPEQALGLVSSDIDDLLKDNAVIEEKDNAIQMPDCTYGTSADIVNIATYQPDKVELTTSSPCKSVLILSDTYDSGWHVSVDGHTRPILHANYLFRGVALEPGMHEVVFTYMPISFIIGLFLCFSGLIIVIVVFIYAKKRKQPAR